MWFAVISGHSWVTFSFTSLVIRVQGQWADHSMNISYSSQHGKWWITEEKQV